MRISMFAAVSALMLMSGPVSAETRLPDGSKPPSTSAGPPQIEDLACSVETPKARRRAHYIVYGNGKEHYTFEGPEMMTSTEASFRKKRLELEAAGKHGNDVKVTYGVVDTPGSCSFIYRAKGAPKLALAHGTQAHLEKRRKDIVGIGGEPLSSIACKTDAVEPLTKPFGSTLSTEEARAYGRSQDSGCAAAEKCLWTAAKAQNNVLWNKAACDCEKAAGQMFYCTSKGLTTTPANADSRG